MAISRAVGKWPAHEIDAAEIRIRAERRIGELMQAQRESVGLANGGQPYQQKSTGGNNPPVEPTLAEAGTDKDLAKRARKYAAVPTDERIALVERRAS